VSTIAATFGASNTTGNLIAVAVWWVSTTITLNSVTDSQGNTYTLVGSSTQGNGASAQLAYAKNITGGSAITVTAHFSGSTSGAVVIHEVSGADASSPLVSSNGQYQNSPGTGTDAISSGALSFSGSNNYVFGAAFDDNGNNTVFTKGTGFNQRVSGNLGSNPYMSEDAIQTQPATFTTNVGASKYLTIGMAFKPGGSGTSAADSSGGGSTGTLTNSPVWTTGGKINGALTFANASDNYVDVANPATFAFERTNPFTMAAWVYRTSTANENDIMAKMGPPTTWIGYDMFMSAGSSDITCTLNGSTGSGIAVNTTSAAVTTNAWHHIVETYDGSSTAAGVNIYVDGVLQPMYVNSDSLSMSILVATDLKIGTDVPGQGDSFDGMIDDVRVYNRALSAGEVWRLYNGAP
jgi:hypothetical protein